MTATGIVRITDTLQYIPKAFAFPKTTTEDYLQQEIGDIIEIMKDPTKTLPFLSYGYETKNAINHIPHIMQRSISHPHLKILPLPPMLPQSQNENIQHQKIISTPAPAPRVEPFSQPPRVQTQDPAPTPPPREQPSTPPRLDPHSNLLIKKFAKYKKTLQILKARKTHVAPRKVQHQLRQSPRNVGTNYRTQVSQHLVSNHIFKLPHAYHIYNKQGKKETIDTLLMGGDSDTWWKAVGNELGRLANGIDNRVRATNTI